jgi:hypothetical protein
MLKNILNLKGAQKLTKNEQKSINGGRMACDATHLCPAGQCCISKTCWYCLEP